MQNFIDRASNIHVIKGASKIKSDNLNLNNIIGSSNQMVSDTTNALFRHFHRNSIIPVDHIKQYIAASTLLHSLDGWGYLSHAVESLLKGDGGIAIHLAYYAELRASMSFLASEGIGVFDHLHICVNSSGIVYEDPGVPNNRRGHQRRNKKLGTHAMVWEAIDKWSNSQSKPVNSDLLQVFSVNSKTFKDWVDAFPFTSNTTVNSVLKQWMKEWNFDVNFFKDDRKMRNEVSYRPKRLINSPPKYSVNATINKLSSYWDILEPSQSNRFQLLDKYLLRILIHKMYDNLSNTIKRSHSLDETVRDTLNNLGLTHDESLIKFLNDRNNTHKIFSDATNHSLDSISKTLNPLSVIARAILILRISTGSASVIFNKAGVKKHELNFLWESYGVENGFWGSGNAPDDFAELWDHIKDYVEEVVDWADSKKPDLSLFKIYEDPDIPVAFNYFKQFNRACLWGISI